MTKKQRQIYMRRWREKHPEAVKEHNAQTAAMHKACREFVAKIIEENSRKEICNV